MGTSFLEPALSGRIDGPELRVRREVIGYGVYYNTHWDEGQRPAIMAAVSGGTKRPM